VGTNRGAGLADEEQSNLIAVLKGRDRSVWSDVVDRHLGEVYGFVFHLVGGDRAVAEDLNQETWLEALDGIDRCDAAHGNFRNWLYGIARRRVALYYRRRKLTGAATSIDGQISDAMDPGDGAILPQDILEQVERTSVVRAAMLALPDDRRDVLHWKYVEGLSVDAIAGRMGRTAKAAESLLSRARQEMRALLGEYIEPRDNVRRSGKELSDE
jgi:RNA polymerase sigma-70 factor, ECF subfamily